MHPDVVNREDVGVVERRDGPRFLLEAPKPNSVDSEPGRQHLERHLAPQSRVARAVDYSHSAFAERSGDFVRSEAGAGTERHAGPSSAGSIAELTMADAPSPGPNPGRMHVAVYFS